AYQNCAEIVFSHRLGACRLPSTTRHLMYSRLTSDVLKSGARRFSRIASLTDGLTPSGLRSPPIPVFPGTGLSLARGLTMRSPLKHATHLMQAILTIVAVLGLATCAAFADAPPAQRTTWGQLKAHYRPKVQGQAQSFNNARANRPKV